MFPRKLVWNFPLRNLFYMSVHLIAFITSEVVCELTWEFMLRVVKI